MALNRNRPLSEGDEHEIYEMTVLQTYHQSLMVFAPSFPLLLHLVEWSFAAIQGLDYRNEWILESSDLDRCRESQRSG